MENGSRAPAPGWLAAFAVALVLTTVSAVHEPFGATDAAHGAPASAISRFAVSFDEPAKQHVKEHLLRKGYVILSEGPGFYAVTYSESLEVPTSSKAGAAVVAQAGTAASVMPDPPFQSSSKARRRLIEQRLSKQKDAQHLVKLSGIPGVHSSEHDVRRQLHMRPSYTLRGMKSLSEAAAAAMGPRLHSRRLSAAVVADLAKGRSSGSGQQAAASPADHLTGHWHTSKSLRPSQYEIWGSSVGDVMCAGRDVQLADAAGAEVLPWGVSAIGARDQKLLAANPKGRAIVCIIDSGIWAGHPEYRQMPGAPFDQIDGCKVNANCPYDWSSDIVGHGTHVAGTIGAPENGIGVIGVISKGAEIHVVRIWNDSGDVSQGQGPYATDLILAYDNCLAHLEEKQKSDKKAKMVINMSYGSAGPLTAERLWIQKAAQRGDVLFVGSAGNNGTYLSWDSYRTEPEPGQYLSYPASYPFEEVLSVANMRCDNTIDYSSQKNTRVSISAPGMAILSSVPRDYGAVRAYITTNKPLPEQMAPADSDSFRDPVGEMYGIDNSGGSSTRSSKSELKVRSGLGYLPNGYREPRAIQGSGIGSSGGLRISQCSVAADVKSVSVDKPPSGTKQPQTSVAGCTGARDAVCLVELPGSKIDWYHETCLAMLKCVRGGGKGLVIWRNDSALMGMGDAAGDFYTGFQPDEFLLGTQLNCGTKCACWAELRKQLGCSSGDCAAQAPPGIVVAAQHAQALLDGAKASSDFRVNITNYEYNYRHYDGTSMAAPHVTGAAALLWRLFPDCSAADISDALKQSAEKLPAQADLAAGRGLLRVDRAFDWIQQNKQCAQS